MLISIKKIKMESYPIIKVPDNLKGISDKLPPFPSKPIEPKVPKKIENLPIEPKFEEIKEPKSPQSEHGCFWYPLIGGVILFFVLIGVDEPEKFIFFIILSVIAVLVGFWGLRNGSKESDDNHNRYYKAMSAYPQLVQEAKNKYQLELVKYKERLSSLENEYKERVELFKNYEYPMYLANLSAYEKEIERLNEPSYVLKYRTEERLKFFKNVTKPGVHPTVNDIKKGASEESFNVFLKQVFGNIVFQNYTLVDSNFNKPYLPDFTIYDRSIGLCIDIEIDEPYIGSSGKPIHFSDSEHDKKRDAYFTNNGWIVVRFAEKQVIEKPEDCCTVIAEVINEVCDGLTNYGISQHISLSPIRKWTKDEAHEMAFRRERNKYLKTELIEKLNLEQHEISEEYMQEIPKKEEKVIEKKTGPIIMRRNVWDDYSDDLPF